MATIKTMALEVKEPKFPTNVPTFSIGEKCDGCVDFNSQMKPIIKARDPEGNTITCDANGKLADPFVRDMADKGTLRPKIAALAQVVEAHADKVMSSKIVTEWLKEQKKTPLLD